MELIHKWMVGLYDYVLQTEKEKDNKDLHFELKYLLDDFMNSNKYWAPEAIHDNLCRKLIRPVMLVLIKLANDKDDQQLQAKFNEYIPLLKQFSNEDEA